RRATATLQATIFAGCALLGFGCSNTESSPANAPPIPAGAQPWFQECADARSLTFIHESGHTDRYLMPEIMCGGVALFDMDNDGDLDVYLVQGGTVVPSANEQLPGNMLFANDGSGSFTDISDSSGADDSGYGMGVTVGDYDNDGDPDLYVTNLGPNVLLRNDGSGVFTDVTDLANVGHGGWGASAAFLDYDNDGDLDLFVTNYLNWSPATEIECYKRAGGLDYCSPANYYAPPVDVLYQNNGDGVFTDVSESAGLLEAFGTGLGVICADFNMDGRTDIFVANDGMPDQLWINQGDGTFRDEAMLRGVAIDMTGAAKAGMGVAVADLDDDRDPDLLVVNLRNETDSFYRNEGSYFADRTAEIGLANTSRPFTRFGLGFVDFDNDGRLDLYQANGRVSRFTELYTNDPFAEPNLLYRGTAGGQLEEVLPRGGTAELLAATSRGAAFGDIDNDGRIDILIVNRDHRAHLLRNTVTNSGHWITLRLVNEHGSDAIGATVHFTVGDRTITRYARIASSYFSANDPRVHCGLGEAATVDQIEVRWPDATVETFGPQNADQFLMLTKGTGSPAE
ncbi:MAG: CRTAC1 family protein, partial [Planctomycetota bacterium]|nr:CRTAC1 family protein [Planctomycetota bacterium]